MVQPHLLQEVLADLKLVQEIRVARRREERVAERRDRPADADDDQAEQPQNQRDADAALPPQAQAVVVDVAASIR